MITSETCETIVPRDDRMGYEPCGGPVTAIVREEYHDYACACTEHGKEAESIGLTVEWLDPGIQSAQPAPAEYSKEDK